MLRTGKSWISERDRRAVMEVTENLELYLLNHPQVLVNMRQLYLKSKRDQFENEKYLESIKELKEEVTME